MITKIDLVDFRNFKKKKLEFSPETTVIIGPNASGKTNILESIFLVAAGKSFHARIEEEMIAYNADIARINGQVVGRQQVAGEKKMHSTSYILPATNLEVVLTRGEIEVGDDKYEKAPRKKLLVNGIPRRLIDFAGNLKVVLFAPQDLDMVTQEPTLRRRFLDTVLSQVDRNYRRAALSYEKGLRQRNRLLFRIREEGLSRSQLLFWDKLLIKNGDYISQKREEFINFANNTEGIDDQNFKLEYDKSAISEARLEQYAQEEVAAATTLVGPHRDDFVFRITNHESRITRARELARFGSRGEQRMGVLWLKLVELAFIKGKTDEVPTLLLDDIFSELDHEHRRVVMGVLGNQQTPLRQGFAGQAIITTADPHYIVKIKGVEKIALY